MSDRDIDYSRARLCQPLFTNKWHADGGVIHLQTVTARGYKAAANQNEVCLSVMAARCVY